MTWNKDLCLLKNFALNMQCTSIKYEIVRKPMVLERLVANLVNPVFILGLCKPGGSFFPAENKSL